MRKTLAEIAEIVQGEVVGDKDIIITGFSSLDAAKEGDLTFVHNPKYMPLVHKTKASAIITPRDMIPPKCPIIRTDNPSLAFAKAISYLDKEKRRAFFSGIHKTAIVAEGVQLGKNVTIGPYAVVEGECVIGDETVIYGHCYIARKTIIGKNCLMYPHVTLRESIQVGNRVVIHSGTVIGSDGFGYEIVAGNHQKIPQVGIVVIEDDVEIGANATIDRARFEKTIIGQGTKIDNLVQIAHNVVIGKNCVIVAQVGISGSTVMGAGTIIGGQAGLTGHIKIGEKCMIAAQSGVSKSWPAKSKISGYPARTFMETQRINANLHQLPRYFKNIQALERKVEQLNKKLKKK